jgi:peroxiredoxin
MNTILLVSVVVLLAVVLVLAFLVVGALEALGRLNWRLDQLEATRPRRMGREGLKPGAAAPDFTLRDAAGRDVSLHDFAGRKVLLIFTQIDCGPCEEMAAEFRRVHHRGDYHVLVVNHGDAEATRAWSARAHARFPVLIQENFSISKKYEAFATPFAFVIDEKGVIASQGIVGSPQYLKYVLSDADRARKEESDAVRVSTADDVSHSSLLSEELSHV